MVLPRAGASLRNPDVRMPMLRADEDGYYIEMQVEADPAKNSELAVIRRVTLDNISPAQWEELKSQYAEINLKACIDSGLSKGLEKIQDRRVQRLFMALLTFLNPRQVAIIFYLYKLAAEQEEGPVVTFRSNDLLEALGYTRAKDGSFTARSRSQLNQDLVSLHRTELVLAQSLKKGRTMGAQVSVKSVLRIRGYEIDNVPRDFDLTKAADYTFELADSYTLSLEFFEGSDKAGDYVLFPKTVDIKQRLGSNTKNNYKMKLITYLASRIKWDKLEEGKFLTISKRYLLKNLDLFGSNSSRNNSILWRTIQEVESDGYVLNSQEIPGKRKRTSLIRFHINSSVLVSER
ncbi:MAG: hypothetical protein AAGA40_16075 [Cyanobacteria bacterium P01_E01_bin.45]